MESKYDEYGNLKNVSIDTIIAGDHVQYKDTRSILIGKNRKTVKVILKGIWDGTKVEFDDSEHTTVRCVEWLKKIHLCPSCGQELNIIS